MTSLADPSPPVLLRGAVLAGGASRRMGGDKALVEVDGVPMARRVASAMERAGCVDVVAVGGAARLRELGLTVVPDRWPGAGPLGGIVTALEAVAAELDAAATTRDTEVRVVVAACDLPWLDHTTIGALASALGAAPSRQAAIAYAGRLQPLCAIWRLGALAPLREAFDRGVRSVNTALEGLPTMRVAVGADALRNVNSPADLRR